jgi:hypothetical protein
MISRVQCIMDTKGKGMGVGAHLRLKLTDAPRCASAAGGGRLMTCGVGRGWSGSKNGLA